MRDAHTAVYIQRLHHLALIGERERMGHARVDARLRADAEVVHHAVLRGEVFSLEGIQELVEVHEALVDGHFSVAGHHVSGPVGVPQEHGLDFGAGGLSHALG